MSYTCSNSYITLWLSMMHGQEFLTLYWPSYSQGSRDVCASVPAHKCDQLFHYTSGWPILILTPWLTQTYIVDAHLTLSFRLGHRVSRILFCLWRWPWLRLWMLTTNHHSDYPRCETNNHWCSLDDHFQDVVGSVSVFIWVIQGANIFKKKWCSTDVHILWLSVGYLNVTVNRPCRNAEPEIGTNGHSPTWHHPWVDRYGSGFGPRSSDRLGF